VKNVFLKIVGLSKNDLPHTHLKKQAGFSLLEVMISALILSTGLLGVASLQIVGMKGTQQSSMKNQAMGVVQNITERMRANHEGVIGSDYLANSAAFNCAVLAPNCSAGTCTATEIATADLHNLICGFGTPRTGGVNTVAAGDIGILVNGSLDIACAGAPAVAGGPAVCTDGDVRVTVQWDESALGEEAVTRDSLILTTRIAAP